MMLFLTSVEFDHADIYDSFESVIRAFEGLADRIRPGGRLICCMDYPMMKRVVDRSDVPVITYGSHAITMARFVPENVRVEGDYTLFDLMDNGNKIDAITLSMDGMHNVLNAISVYILAKEHGLDLDQVKSAFKSFQGIKRRQEVRGVESGVTVMDDFGHHPTAIRETLKGLKMRYPNKRLVAVFEPRSATARRKVFQKDFTKAFKEADVLFLAKPFNQEQIAEEERFSSLQVVDALQAKGMDAFVMSSVDEGVPQITEFSKEGDLVVVLSNGGFDNLITKLLTALRQ